MSNTKPSSLSIISAAIFIILLVVLALYIGKDNKKDQNYTPSTKDVAFGKKDAKVTFVEYFDFECPACQMLASQILPQLEQKYQDRVLFIYKQFPLSYHQTAIPAAAASICANDQGKYREYRDLLIKNYEVWTQDVNQLSAYAQDIDLDLDEFNSCRESDSIQDKIEADFQEGQKKGIQATPTVFINGEKIEGVANLSDYEQKIDQALNK